MAGETGFASRNPARCRPVDSRPGMSPATICQKMQSSLMVVPASGGHKKVLGVGDTGDRVRESVDIRLAVVAQPREPDS